MTYAVECVVQTHDEVGETPLWSTKEGALYWIDVTRPRIHRWDPIRAEVVSRSFDEEIGSIGLRKEGGVVAAMRSGFFLVDFEADKLTPIIDPEAEVPGNCLNDGRCDRHGRFWAGSAWFGTGAAGETTPVEPTGAFYRLDPDGNLERMLGGIFETNTVAWSPDDRIMYLGDSRVGEIYAFDFDAEEGTLSNRRIFVQTRDGDEFHDGSAIDAAGFLWTTIWNGWRVVRFTPDGSIDRVIELPVQRPTACCFGGQDCSTLYVTTATWGLSDTELAEQPLAGGVLAVATGVKGELEAYYSG